MARPRSSTLAPSLATGSESHRRALFGDDELPPMLDAWQPSIWGAPDDSTAHYRSLNFAPNKCSPLSSISASPLAPPGSGPSRIGRDRASTLAVGAIFPHNLHQSMDRTASLTPDPDPVLASALVQDLSAEGDSIARRASAEPQLALPPAVSSMASKALWNRLNLVSQDDQLGRRRAASMMGPPERGGHTPSPLAQEEPDHARLAFLSIREQDPFIPKIEGLPPSWTRTRSGTVGAFASSPGGYTPLASLPSSLRAHQLSVPSPFATSNENERSYPSSPSSVPAPHLPDDQDTGASATPLEFNASSAVSQAYAASGQGVPAIHSPVYPWTGYSAPYLRPTAPTETSTPLLSTPAPSGLAKQAATPSAPASVSPKPTAAAAGQKSSSKNSTGPPPSRALWIGSLPPNLSTAALTTLFRRWGPLESTRVLSIKNCAFVNFVNVEDAVSARKAIVGTRWDAWDHSVGLGLGLDAAGFDAGTIKSEFAKASPAPVTNNSSTRERATPSAEPKGNPFSAVARERNAAHGLFSASNSIVPSSDRGGVSLPPEMAVTGVASRAKGDPDNPWAQS